MRRSQRKAGDRRPNTPATGPAAHHKSPTVRSGQPHRAAMSNKPLRLATRWSGAPCPCVAGSCVHPHSVDSALNSTHDPPCNGLMTDDPTRRTVRRPITPVLPTPAYGAVTFHEVWTNSGVLCLECRQCAKRTALTKHDLPHSRLGNVRYVLHAIVQVLGLRRGQAAPVRSDDGRGEDVSRGRSAAPADRAVMRVQDRPCRNHHDHVQPFGGSGSENGQLHQHSSAMRGRGWRTLRPDDRTMAIWRVRRRPH